MLSHKVWLAIRHAGDHLLGVGGGLRECWTSDAGQVEIQHVWQRPTRAPIPLLQDEYVIHDRIRLLSPIQLAVLCDLPLS